MGCSSEKWGLNCPMQGNPDSQIREIFTIGIRVPRIQNCLEFLYMGPFKPLEIGIICHCQKDSCKTGFLGQGYHHKKCSVYSFASILYLNFSVRRSKTNNLSVPQTSEIQYTTVTLNRKAEEEPQFCSFDAGHAEEYILSALSFLFFFSCFLYPLKGL